MRKAFFQEQETKTHSNYKNTANMREKPVNLLYCTTRGRL